jgi:hypothetical protein
MMGGRDHGGQGGAGPTFISLPETSRQRTRISRRGSGASKGVRDSLSALPGCTPVDELFRLVPVVPLISFLGCLGGKFANGVACRGEACWGEACWT